MNKQQARREALKLAAAWIESNIGSGYIPEAMGLRGITSDSDLGKIEVAAQEIVDQLMKRASQPGKGV